MKSIILPCIIIGLIALSCQSEYSTQDDQLALRQFNEIWEANGNSGNRLANVDLFTDDGILVRSGNVHSGKEEIREFLNNQEAEIRFIHQESKQVKTWTSKEYFMSVGLRTITYIDSSTGDTISASVPAVNIFERQPDGSFKLACSMKDSNGR
ncbi:MAG: hypothetical protein R2751_07860 [Bacteroidales bacterium]